MKIKFVLVLLLLAGFIFPLNALLAQNDGHEVITGELIRLFDDKPEIRVMLKKSLEKPKSINPDPITNPAQDLESYYTFVERRCGREETIMQFPPCKS